MCSFSDFCVSGPQILRPHLRPQRQAAELGLSEGGAATAARLGQGPWSPRLAAPRPTICSTSVGPSWLLLRHSVVGARHTRMRSRFLTNCKASPFHLRAEHDQFLGSAGSQLRVGRPFAKRPTIRNCKRPTPALRDEWTCCRSMDGMKPQIEFLVGPLIC